MIEIARENSMIQSNVFRFRSLSFAVTLLLLSGMTLATCSAQDAPATPVIPKAHIYPTIESGPADVQAAIAEARRTHRRVIVDFGGDWCGDCQVLNIYFHQAPNAELTEKNFVRVNVNIGRMDANLDLAKKYGVPVTGVPALAVLDDNGKLLYAQTKEFADMRHMQSSDLTEFLNKWKRP